MARERLAEKRLYSARLTRGGHHRADLIRLGERPEAIEVELTPKGASRLDLLLRSWRRSIGQRHVRSVLYCCAPEALGGVERAITRTCTEELIRVEPLADYSPALPLR